MPVPIASPAPPHPQPPPCQPPRQRASAELGRASVAIVIVTTAVVAITAFRNSLRIASSCECCIPGSIEDQLMDTRWLQIIPPPLFGFDYPKVLRRMTYNW